MFTRRTALTLAALTGATRAVAPLTSTAAETSEPNPMLDVFDEFGRAAAANNASHFDVNHTYRIIEPDGTTTTSIQTFRRVAAADLPGLLAVLVARPASVLDHPIGTVASTALLHVEPGAA